MSNYGETINNSLSFKMCSDNTLSTEYNNSSNVMSSIYDSDPDFWQKCFKSSGAYDYFTDGLFEKDKESFQSFNNLYTGFDNIDIIQPLYPGLYTIGAVPSLGKTTFCHQMADNIAFHKQLVLYFSLEQSMLELFTKSLARGFFRTKIELDKKYNGQRAYPTPSSMDIRRNINDNSLNQEIENQINFYRNSAQNYLNIINSTFLPTVEDIINAVEAYIDKCKKVPIVFIDYLQIIRPSSLNGRTLDIKSSIDHIIQSMKELQTKYNMIIFLISSMNRMNYTMPVDYSSFKESGGIEYASDVIWGLQLSIMSDNLFNKCSSIPSKREMIIKAKAEVPRHLELVCLKNRNGMSNYKVEFEYYTASDFFRPLFPSM